MTHEAEVVMIQHRFTEQVICVERDAYLAGAHARYRNWQMKGQGRFIAPPPLFPQPQSCGGTPPHPEGKENDHGLCHC